jgi:hypothetical protein
MKRVIDTYFKAPFIWDMMILLVIISLERYCCIKYGFCLDNNRSRLEELLNELISSSMAVGGFIITALAIILTLRENIPSKPLTESKSGDELLFNSGYYFKIITVFSRSAYICVGSFALFACLKIFNNHIDDYFSFIWIMSSSFFLFMTVIRCIFILHLIIIVRQSRVSK